MEERPDTFGEFAAKEDYRLSPHIDDLDEMFESYQLKQTKMEEKPKYLREVIRIDGESENPVEFTDCLDVDSGWIDTISEPKDFKKIIYLGECAVDGDMFAVYNYEEIQIFKGHLNSGKY